MTRNLVWVSKELAIRVHAQQLARHGGESGVLNEAHLDAALTRACTAFGYLPDMTLEELAALTAVAIVKGHPFVDGNKRTACVVSLLFLRLNGVEISTSEDELADVFLEVASGTRSESGLAEWFAENAIPLET